MNELLPTLSGPSTPRHHAFIAVDQVCLETVLKYAPPAEKFDTYGKGFVTLVSHDKREGDFSVGLSYLVPRVYTLLEGCGWDNVYSGDEIACP